eukprot:CAMPEP_0117504680 /NCGR_PEP_ID=MMETSP0784-20121206/24973_1 /TAXON_ID=39447 /ORGANISM="" /LENGTH=84 /DNA_ID=CAMNT_0005300041 /DNA_START=301 /DNA_END=551 /DNA_ORIENTATION=-
MPVHQQLVDAEVLATLGLKHPDRSPPWQKPVELQLPRHQTEPYDDEGDDEQNHEPRVIDLLHYPDMTRAGKRPINKQSLQLEPR